MEINGITIPAGYTPLEEWRESHPDSETSDSMIRRFEGDIKRNIEFVLDPKNIELLELQERFRRDTKLFRSALHKEFRRNGLNIRAIGNGKEKSREKRSLTILLRPPHFAMLPAERQRQQTKFRRGSRESVFIFHFDQNNKLQIIRSYLDIEDDRFERFEIALGRHLGSQIKLFERHYGNWENMAKLVTDSIVRIIR